MYEILKNGEKFCDSRIDELAIINPIVEREANKVGSFSFTIPKTHPFFGTLTLRKTRLEVYNFGEKIFDGVPIRIETDFLGNETVLCESELSYLNDTMALEKRYTGTVRAVLEDILYYHNAFADTSKHFAVGAIDYGTALSVDFALDYGTSSFDAVKTLFSQDCFGGKEGFIYVLDTANGKTIGYTQTALRTSNQKIEIGKNLLDYSSTSDTASILTGIFPYGAVKTDEDGNEIENNGVKDRIDIRSITGGTTYIINQEAFNAYGGIYKTIIWDEIEEPQELYDTAVDYLANYQWQDLTLELSAIDLSMLSQSFNSFKLLDDIQVVSTPHGLNKRFLLRKIDYDLNSPENNTITLGASIKPSLSQQTVSNGSAIAEAIKEQVNPSEILTQAQENATALITSATEGYVVLNKNADGTLAELLVMDTDDIETAKKVWRWNKNGLGFSPNGYNGNYTTAMTADGQIVANTLVSGATLSSAVYASNMYISGGSLIVNDLGNDTTTVVQINSKIPMAGTTYNIKSTVNLQPLKFRAETANELYGTTNYIEIFSTKAVFHDETLSGSTVNKKTQTLAIDTNGRLATTSFNATYLYENGISLSDTYEAKGTCLKLSDITSEQTNTSNIFRPLGLVLNNSAVRYMTKSNFNTWLSASTKRFKKNIKPLDEEWLKQIHKLYDIEVKSWNYIDKYTEDDADLKAEQIGVIAEELEEVLPSAIWHDTDGKTASYQDRTLLNALLVLVQEQKAEIDNLKKRVETLERSAK